MTDRPMTRKIRHHVLSSHVELVDLASNDAAVHRDDVGLRLLATAFDPAASVEGRPLTARI